MVYLRLEVHLDMTQGLGQVQSTKAFQRSYAAADVDDELFARSATHLGWLERIVGRKVDLNHEDSTCIGAVWRSAATKQRSYQQCCTTKLKLSDNADCTDIPRFKSLNQCHFTVSKLFVKSMQASSPHYCCLPMEEVIWRCRSCRTKSTAI